MISKKFNKTKHRCPYVILDVGFKPYMDLFYFKHKEYLLCSMKISEHCVKENNRDHSVINKQQIILVMEQAKRRRKNHYSSNIV